MEACDVLREGLVRGEGGEEAGGEGNPLMDAVLAWMPWNMTCTIGSLHLEIWEPPFLPHFIGQSKVQ